MPCITSPFGTQQAWRPSENQRVGNGYSPENEEARLTLVAVQLFELHMRNRIAGVARVVADGSFLRVNPALCAFLGLDADELLGSTWQGLTHPGT